jgi:hypothetical protein
MLAADGADVAERNGAKFVMINNNSCEQIGTYTCVYIARNECSCA